MTTGEVPPPINKPWFINPGLTLPEAAEMDAMVRPMADTAEMLLSKRTGERGKHPLVYTST